MSTGRKILVVGPAWLGDMVMAQALFMLLKTRYPEATVDVIAPAWSQPILACMPEVDHALQWPFGHHELNWRGRYQLGRQLRTAHYDQAILLPNSWKSALPVFIAQIPQRTGWLGEYRYFLLNDYRVLNPQALPRMVQRFYALGLEPDAPMPEYFPLPQLTVAPAQVQATLAQFQLTLDKPVLALCPGAEFGPAKCWPPDYYAQLAQQFLAQNFQVWILGSPNDKNTADLIAAQAPGVMNLTGQTRISDVLALLAAATAVVSNDSGLMHVASALRRPIVVPYGSTSPDFAPPLTDKKRILYRHLSCSPCRQRTCPLGHHRCLRDITPTEVASAVAQLIA